MSPKPGLCYASVGSVYAGMVMHERMSGPGRAAMCAPALAALLSVAIGSSASGQTQPSAPSQAAPRFASLKSDRVNVRRGPGPEHGIEWVFRRAGLPVEVIADSEVWRRVRDSEGSSGWVLASLLSGRRTALVEPWDVKPNVPPPHVALKAEGRDNAGNVAQVEAGVIANVRSCDGRWCFVGIGEISGYIEQRRLWGVYKGETVK